MSEPAIHQLAPTHSPQISWEHLLYRIYDAADALLYVGRTNDLNVRFRRHAQQKPWWPAASRATVELLPTFEALVIAEREAILTEQPTHNIIHNGVIVTEQDEAGWHEPWLSISARVTAGADALHDRCRTDRAISYPDEGFRMTAPCSACGLATATVLVASDAATGHADPSVSAAHDVLAEFGKPRVLLV